MDFNLVGTGSNTNTQQDVDPSYKAARVTLRPIEWAPQNSVPGGHFSISAMTGTMAAGIASLAQVFQVRWGDPTRFFLLKKLQVQCATLTGFAATSLGAPLELIIGHGSTANGSGGTALAPTSISNKMRGGMNATGFATSGEIRIATTAALTAATGQTLEPAPIASCLGAANATLVQTTPLNLFEQREHGDHPLIILAGDTFTIRTNTPAATGTWVVAVTMDWAELVTF